MVNRSIQSWVEYFIQHNYVINMLVLLVLFYVYHAMCTRKVKRAIDARTVILPRPT